MFGAVREKLDETHWWKLFFFSLKQWDEFSLKVICCSLVTNDQAFCYTKLYKLIYESALASISNICYEKTHSERFICLDGWMLCACIYFYMFVTHTKNHRKQLRSIVTFDKLFTMFKYYWASANETFYLKQKNNGTLDVCESILFYRWMYWTAL